MGTGRWQRRSTKGSASPRWADEDIHRSQALRSKGAQLLFQIFTEREKRKATAVATNSPFTEWDKTFGDARRCAAIADRITLRCTLIQTGTEFYRYQTTQESLFTAQS
ncbi:ATP-binding protein [Streptomyces sp. NPDC060006]|uniref:ATP-binding protein n=1 Tax=unclassified Streptomyces TaxID=2593676 RepID=UPI00368FE991